MPKGKLKAALATHTVNAQRYAAAKKKEAHKHDKEASVKASMSGAKKAAKRKARAEGRSEGGKKRDGYEKEGKVEAEGAIGTVVAVAGAGGAGDEDIGEDAAGPSKPTASTAPTPSTTNTSSAIRPTIPFIKSDTILLLGEANFSFALSLVTHHRHPGHQLLATSYDSEEVCYHKYPDAEDNVRRLREQGAGVEFGVDGGRLERCKRVGKGRWSRVIMNFPHTGSGIKDQDRNIRDNQLLLLRVLRSVAPVLTVGPANMLPNSHTGLKRKPKVKNGKGQGQDKKRKAESSDDEDDADVAPVGAEDVSDFEADQDETQEETDSAYLPAAGSTTRDLQPLPPNRPGTLLITLLDQAPYTLWALRQLATRPPASIPNAKPADRGPQPRYALLRSFQFVPQAYPGYAHRRTLGFKEGLSKEANQEIVGRKGVPRTWEFALNPKVD